MLRSQFHVSLHLTAKILTGFAPVIFHAAKPYAGHFTRLHYKTGNLRIRFQPASCPGKSVNQRVHYILRPAAGRKHSPAPLRHGCQALLPEYFQQIFIGKFFQSAEKKFTVSR